MKKKYVFLLGMFILIFTSCALKLKQDDKVIFKERQISQGILIYDISEKIPNQSEILKEIKIGYGLFYQNCDGCIPTLEKIKLKAKQIGGNAIKIIDNRPFNSVLHENSCHNITAQILNIKSQNIKNNKNNTLKNNYATLYFYRYRGSSIIRYPLSLNDSLISTIKSNFKDSIKVFNNGVVSIQTRKNKNNGFKIEIENGKSYYIKCSVKIAFPINKPKLELMDFETGAIEFNSFKASGE